ncbi:MAG: tetratricopeptide repeat protein, partial [Burkholderiales bacterium]|nr:tetratricopeptide repeat protein [Burkholderiales bacterium]
MCADIHKEFDSAAARSLEGRVWKLFESKNINQAVTSCKQLNRQFPKYASGWHTASQLAIKLNKPGAALSAIERALAVEPENKSWLLQKALCLSRLGRFETLRPLVDQLLPRNFATAYHCSTMALLLTQLGRRGEAVRLYEKAAAIRPDEAKHYYNIACLQRSLGDAEGAEENFTKTVGLDPSDYESYKIRSELRKQTPTRNHVEELERLLANGIADE